MSAFVSEDEFDPIPPQHLYVPHYRAICQTCGSKPICNGCSDCGKCER